MLIRYTRHNEILILNRRPGKMEAHYFNHVQAALRKFGPQIRLRIPGLKHLELLIQRDAWVVVDLVLSEYPVLCWTNFEVKSRENVHDPIQCEVRYFHYASSMIYNKTIKGMDAMLSDLLNENIAGEKHSVIPFKKE